MNEILCSTGALLGRPNKRDYRLLSSLAEKLCFDGYELMIYDDWYNDLDGLIDTLKPLKLNIPVIHMEKGIGEELTKKNFKEAERRFETDCFIANKLGANKLVLHLWNGLLSDSEIENNLSGYLKLKAISDSFGLTLMIENVVCNKKDPMAHWLELKRRYPDVKFVFDTKMSQFHGQTELLYDEEYSWLFKDNHILHYHVNDYGGGVLDWANLKTLPIGKGNVDFNRFFDHIKNIGYKGMFSVESTAFNKEGLVDTDVLNEQYKLIKSKLNK